MRKNNDLRKGTSLNFDLPSVSSPGSFIAELYNGNRLVVEGFKAITKYESDSIGIKIKLGLLQINGGGLKMVRLSSHQLVILGRIDSVNIYRRN